MIRRGCAAAAASMVLTAACARAPAPAPPPAPEPLPPLAALEVQAVAELLELEDRGEVRPSLLAEYASAEHPVVRSRVALTVARVGDRSGAPVARALLTDSDTSVAATSAFAAGRLADSAAVPALLALLAPPRDTLAPTVAAEAARALARIGTPEATGAIANYLLGADTVATDRNRDVVRAALSAAAGIDSLDRRALGRWLNASDPGIRAAAAAAVGIRAGPGVGALLVPTLEDPDAGVRAAALRSLSRPEVASSSAAAPVATALLRLLSDSLPQPRVDVIRAAGAYPHPALRSTLDALAHEGPAHERVAAVDALARWGAAAAPAVPVLSELASDPAEHPYLRARAVRAWQASDPESFRAAVDRLRSDPSWRVRAAAAEALAATGDLASATESFARDPDPRVARAVLEALAMSEDPTPHRRLLLEAAQASDPHLRASAIRGLGRIRDAALFPFVLDAYAAAQDDLEPDAQLAAIEAIAGFAEAGLLAAPERAFFARFGRPQDERVRELAYLRFGSAAERYWGAPIPTESPRSPASYGEMALRWIAPLDPGSTRPRVAVSTERGEFVLELFSDAVPLAAANFLALVEVGYYAGQEVAAVDPGRSVDFGAPRGDLAAGPGYTLRPQPSRAEVGAGDVAIPVAGAELHGSLVSIAIAAEEDAGSAPTVLGRIVEGFDVVTRLLPGDRVESAQELDDSE